MRWNVTLNNSNRTKIDVRRRRVAEMRLRHLTQREIAEELQKTDTPGSVATVNRDIKHLEQQWKAEAVRDTGILKGNHVAELREARRTAWQGRNGKPELFYIMKGLEQEARVLRLEEQDIADLMGMLADTFLAGYNTMERMEVEDKSD
jgi:hypothetical protein